MKLGGQQVERFLRAPGAPLVLVYGPDQGLVRERVERLIGGVLDDPKDPFRLSELSADAVRGDPGRLLDEARALCLVGGRRVVRLRQASDLVTAACRALLELEPLEALVVIDAGELGPGSSLRRLIEGARHGAAIACYRDEGRDLGALVDEALAAHELTIEPEARSYLVEHLGADRGITRSELAKLVLYCDEPAGSPPARRRVTLEAAAQVVGDSAALDFDDLVHAATLGEAVQVERCLDRLLGEGQSPVSLLRALAKHVGRLHQLACRIERGEAIEQVLDGARPPIHFRRRASVKAELRRWPAARAARALSELLAAEIGCKTTAWPAATLCRRAVLRLCLEARAAARRST
ncbi:MAG: polymerase subunit delta [Geminicoccaceae bacterium]|nr:polymerase subunit delta [Geminicoccaceae bacterium]